MRQPRMKQRKRCVALFLLLTMTVTQCVTPTVAEAAARKTAVVKSIKLDKTVLNLDKGKSTRLTATVRTKVAKAGKLVWKSSRPKVAVVNAKGSVTAKQAGSTKITVTVKGTKNRPAVW